MTIVPRWIYVIFLLVTSWPASANPDFLDNAHTVMEAAGDARSERLEQIEAGISYDHLSNAHHPWQSDYIQFDHRLASRHVLYASLEHTKRFDIHDQQLLAGVYRSLPGLGTLNVEGNVSPSHHVLARYSVSAALLHTLGRGWDMTGGVRHSEYDTGSSDQISGTVEHYFRDYRAAYTLTATRSAGTTAYGNRLQWSYYYNDISSVTLSYSAGREIESEINQLILYHTEFFGVKKGAYTGATQDREGYFQAAHGGTLFLDEIGDLPLSMQSKLLRAIQERCVRPVGGTQEEPVDVRIVSATHKNLVHEVQEGRFRQDLYYRLNVIEIDIPPLRERREDLPELCVALLARIALESGLPAPRLTTAALAQLEHYPLPGNVRELENLLHRAVALSDGGELSFDTLDTSFSTLDAPAPEPAPPITAPAPAASAPASLPADLQDHLDRQEREILIKALQETGFNRTAAAAKLGLSLRQIRYRIARLNIDTPQGNDPVA